MHLNIKVAAYFVLITFLIFYWFSKQTSYNFSKKKKKKLSIRYLKVSFEANSHLEQNKITTYERLRYFCEDMKVFLGFRTYKQWWWVKYKVWITRWCRPMWPYGVRGHISALALLLSASLQLTEATIYRF